MLEATNIVFGVGEVLSVLGIRVGVPRLTKFDMEVAQHWGVV